MGSTQRGLALTALESLWGGAKGAAAVAALIGPLEVVLGLLFGYLAHALFTKRGEQARQTRLGYLAVVFGVLVVYPTLFILFYPLNAVVVQE